MPMTEFQDSETVKVLLRTLEELGITRLDSGARYPPLNPGRSEELIGEAKELSSRFLVDTKIYTDTATDGNGDLTVEAIKKSVDGSLKRLQADNVYSQQRQHEVKQNGLQKPSCYQGVYNLVTRGMETKLLPLLRAHGIVFNGFHRWLMYHSGLGDGDGIVLGASKVTQIIKTVHLIRSRLASLGDTSLHTSTFPRDILTLHCRQNLYQSSSIGTKKKVIKEVFEGVPHAFDKGCEKGTIEWTQREQAYALATKLLKDSLK
ncbi:hypothetical protein F4813DRAFT_390142 [Daldinia decipiens]|uniref:uncharacterized protein n=1 Tax=Daldinia decipiens TaxID=326647 RepID=UPI0020C4C617|nr:uncharacterized protein F4813DRAFT_390142 [Daldinia decipiens]KAI1657170.1 hypothetical protein F4813DRAFT_390142 [Daldinia decipiens]